MEIGVRPDNCGPANPRCRFADRRRHVESGRAAVVQRHAGPHRPMRSLAYRRDDMVIGHDQPIGAEDDARTHGVTSSSLICSVTTLGKHLRGDPLDPVRSEVGHRPGHGQRWGHVFVDSDRMNQQNDGQSGATAARIATARFRNASNATRLTPCHRLVSTQASPGDKGTFGRNGCCCVAPFGGRWPSRYIGFSSVILARAMHPRIAV